MLEIQRLDRFSMSWQDALARPATRIKGVCNLIGGVHAIRPGFCILQDFETSSNFEVSFDLIIHRVQPGVCNLLRFMKSDADGLSLGSCMPAFFLHDSTRLSACMETRNGLVEDVIPSEPPFEIDGTLRVVARLSGDLFVLQVNGVQVAWSEGYSFEAKLPGSKGVGLWASDRFGSAAAATISNLLYLKLPDG